MTTILSRIRSAWPKADAPPPAGHALLVAEIRSLRDDLLLSKVATLTLLRETASAHQSEPVASALGALRELHGIEDEELI